MAWTFSVSFYKDVKMKNSLGGDQMIVLKVACVSDASGGSLTMKSTDLDPGNEYNEYMDRIKGSWLYMIKTVPNLGATQPAGTFDVDVEDQMADHLLDTDANPNDANKISVGSGTLGIYPAILDYVGLVVATLGNTKTADIYLYFLK